jgi:hypothetical protein
MVFPLGLSSCQRRNKEAGYPDKLVATENNCMQKPSHIQIFFMYQQLASRTSRRFRACVKKSDIKNF